MFFGMPAPTLFQPIPLAGQPKTQLLGACIFFEALHKAPKKLADDPSLAVRTARKLCLQANSSGIQGADGDSVLSNLPSFSLAQNGVLVQTARVNQLVLAEGGNLHLCGKHGIPDCRRGLAFAL
jgi:hypothetical protein